MGLDKITRRIIGYTLFVFLSPGASSSSMPVTTSYTLPIVGRLPVPGCAPLDWTWLGSPPAPPMCCTRHDRRLRKSNLLELIFIGQTEPLISCPDQDV